MSWSGELKSRFKIGRNDTRPGDKVQYWIYTSPFMQALLAPLSGANRTKLSGAINKKAGKISKTLTVLLRLAPVWYGDEKTYGSSNGTTIWPPELVYAIQWRYLSFPFLLIVSSAAFFLSTVILTWGEETWKTSQLAILFHGLSERDARTVGSLDPVPDMKAIGEQMCIRLVETEEGKKLVSATAPPH